MKTLFRLFLLFSTASLFVLFNSCEKNNSNSAGTGKAEFSVILPVNAGAKSSTLPDTVPLTYQVMISVEDPAGNPVLTDKLIPLYTFGMAFMSENIELKTGEYRLTKFMVINPAGAVIYAAPRTGSPLAYLCTKPLPFNFGIMPNEVTRVLPEVLEVGDHTPDQFGYASFGFQIIKPLDLWTMCILDNPMIMAPTQLTTARLVISADNGWHYTFSLEASVNHLIIRGGSDVYYFILEKEGYPSQKMKFTLRELQMTSKENPLVLKIPWVTQYKTLVFQPGPDRGKDAMISNLNPDNNFGDYKYFEATFLSEPVLAVMRSNRSLIWFSLDSLPKSAVIKKATLRLMYDLPIPFDSSFVTDTDPSTGALWYGGVLQQIIEPWEENKVTWNTQPKTTEANQVYLPPFIKNANIIEVDVTGLYASVAESVLPDYGILFKLWPSDKFPGFRFASSDFAEPRMRPMLTVYYTL